jgi:AcrR family transcriptional regulator
LHKTRSTGYTGDVAAAEFTANPPPELEEPHSLRAEQVAQTRAALVTAGRQLFGSRGFAATSVDDLARRARVTTGALYHHFSTKANLFEAVFMAAHDEILTQAAKAANDSPTDVEFLARGFDAFLDAVLKPDLARIVVIDAPAVLGLARYTELDEQYAFAAIVTALKAAADSGQLAVADPQTLARLLLGALTRGAMLIANSVEPARTRDEVSAAVRAMLAGFAAR